MNLLYFMVVLSGNLPFKAGVVVTAKASVRPILTFQNFSLRCDKSDQDFLQATLELGTLLRREL